VLDIDLQLLERLPAGGPAAARALVGAQQAKERIARLCTTLRRLSQVGEAKDWSAMEPAVEACKALCLPQLPEGVSLSFALDPTVREVWLGQDDLLSVMSNLVLNSAHALEARPGGGSIWVTLVRHGPRAVLSVRDDGAGIEAQNLARVLDPFFTTRGSKGTGLGLSLVDQIVRSAGGGLTIDSTWGEGTTVSVVLRVI
jgi:signal transduction histidine kinase